MASEKGKQKILLVEDEAALRELVSFNMRNAGHDIVESDNANDALMLLEEFLPDLILSAEAMKNATTLLRPLMGKDGEASKQETVVIGTVQETQNVLHKIMVPPDSRVLKKVSRSTSLATESWMMKRDSSPRYCLVSQVSIQNDSMRTISFCSSPIEPDTSIM